MPTRRISLFLTTLLGALLLPSSITASQSSLMVIMQEKVMGIFGTTGFEQPNQSEITLMQHLENRGYRVIDSSTAKRNITQAKGLRMLEGDDRAAAAAGLQYGADYTVVGKAISKPAGAKLYGSQLQSIHATVTARVIRNSDARVVASGSASAVKAHLDELRGGAMAIEAAIQDLAGQLAARLPRQVQGDTAAVANEKTLNLSGLVSYRHLDYLLRYLEKKVPGMRKVDLLSFTSGSARIMIAYDDPMGKLAKHLSRQKFKGFRVEPTQVTTNSMDIRAVVNR